MRRNVNDLYFQWLCDIVKTHDRNPEAYKSLLIFLNNVDFQYSIERDGDRFADGVELRYLFGKKMRIPQSVIAANMDIYPCSVLEMMIGLSIRCEDIMDDPESGTCVGVWFWEMIDNLGLGEMRNGYFSSRKAEPVIARLLNRQYKRNGKGGLFTTNSEDVDMQKEEIWCQAMWHLNDVRERSFV